MSRTPIICFVLGILLVAPGRGEAVTPETWSLSGVKGWQEARRESVTVTSDGEIALGWGARAADRLQAATVWALLADGRDVLAGTGDQGVVYRISASGRVSEAARVIEPQVTALGRDGKGNVLVGTAPDGTLYRLASGEVVPAADTPETYIWAIVPFGDGAVVATGHAGKLYSLRGDGTLSVLADLGSEHVTGLRADGDGFLATTESPGRLVRVDRRGEITVLHDAEEAELRAPVLAADGTIYFLANPSDPQGVGRLYRRNRSGAVERVWSASSGFAYDLGLSQDGFLWVTTGSDSGKGSVVQVTPGPPSTWAELLEVAEPQILCALLDDPARRWVGTGGGGRVYRLPGEKANLGRVTSKPHDAGGMARWGAASVEPGWAMDGIQLETRKGNTRNPDTTWSAWRDVRLQAGRGPIGGGPARFLQWRLTLTRSETRVEGIRVAYLPANAAPRVKAVTVTKLGTDFDRSWDGSQPASLSQDLPGGVHVEFQVPGNRNQPEKAGNEEAAWARRYRTVTWQAEDPNRDEMRFSVEVRSPGEATWKTLARDLKSSPWIWDSSVVPDGWYLLRVVASDGPSNPLGQSERAFRVSRPVLVDNSPPKIRDLTVRGGVLTGEVEDATSTIRKLMMAVDGKDWTDIFPEDGIADMPTEAIRVKLNDLASGEHEVLVRVVDEAGNMGTGRTRFKVP